jgi:lipid-A-disaccharide synthase
MQIVITVNGPGEVASWLTPLATELKRVRPDLHICVAVVPCVFSSGSEKTVVRSLPFVDAATSVDETMAFIFRNRLPEGFRRNAPGLVMHLGGDSIFTVLLAKRLGVPCLAYVERPISLQGFYDRVFYSGFEHVPAKAVGERGKVVGEMIVDAAIARTPQRAGSGNGRLTVGLYPGSREFMVKHMLPFYAVVAEKIAAARDDVDFVIARADFMPLDYFASIPDVNDGREIEGVNVRMERDGDDSYMVTPAGVRMRLARSGEVAAQSKVVITLPGTNTAELGALGVPIVMLLPTWSAELSPLPGIAGHIGRLPVIGRRIKRALGEATVRSMKYFSHPNRRADRAVIPELVGHITTAQVADKVLELLAADTARLEAELRSIMGAPGAARRLAGEIVDYLGRSEAIHEAAPAR